MNRILLVGCGHMGSALLSAWMNLKSHSLTVVDPLSYSYLKKKYYKKKIIFFDKTPNQNEIKKFDIIIFAIKPQIAKKVLSEYCNFEFKKNSLITSIVAGKKISFFKKNIKNAIQIVRVMPNMPALIGEGVSCLVSKKNISKNNKKTINDLFLKVGKTIWLKNEIEIDKATAISGSGPGYVFTIIDAFEKASQKMGFPKNIAREMVLSNILGSLRLMEKTKKEPSDLADSIAVKGGTTEAGIKILQKNDINKIIYNTFLAAYQRASKLGKIND
ncbi:pyrroline-5-carboxylate reductase [bacterium]|nr:pyrroline-5-carboxylate reductase [bacterium]